MEIVVNVPSIYPDRFKTFIESFNKMESIRDNFKVNIVSRSHTNNADYWDLQPDCNIPRMCELRLKSLKYESDYIMFCDDDLIFLPEAENYYRRILRILELEKPDVLNVYGSRYTSNMIINPKVGLLCTNRGLFVKTSKLKDDDWIKEVSSLKGGDEDVILAYKGLENNGKLIVIGGAPVTRSNQNAMISGNKSKIHDLDIIMDNAYKFITTRYNDINWNVSGEFFPLGLNRGNTMKTVQDTLKEASDIYTERSLQYGNIYKDVHGKVLSALFPLGVELKTELDYTRWCSINAIVAKLARYANNWSKGGHKDSLLDLINFCAMLNEVDDENS
jgi:hypothetical protein